MPTRCVRAALAIPLVIQPAEVSALAEVPAEAEVQAVSRSKVARTEMYQRRVLKPKSKRRQSHP
eukprot:CAMPEP_0177761010 /NCGR_PEP_ID=MMETSP0491_2-20121128/5575_1 /TAXON_ID=63592 /ORGANISM="Tetraselmis chuii, Strain PLY429" /LENGTH=63 /DNA_ID=CAMNT_0019276953 /DNA_START=428 /DNA_END=615 /DNA_ORIENTATION=-